jgi:hypothetical protein
VSGPDFGDKSVVLATAPRRFEVVSRHIRKGVRRDPWRCVYACALGSAPEVLRAYVLKTVAWVEFASHVEKYKLPSSMSTETKVFDANGDFEPGTYELKPYPTRKKPTGKKPGAGTTGPPTYRHISGYIR